MTVTVGAVPLVDLGAVHASMVDDLRAAFERVLEGGRFTSGAEVERFEDALARRVGARHAVGVGSGTAALQLLLTAAGVEPGDEVILPPNTFFATAEAVVHAGAVPVFADVDPDTALLDVDAAAAAITARTAAVIGVHLYGQPVAANQFRALAARHGIAFFEDAAQAFGAAWQSQPVGSLGTAAGFSFYPGKNVGALGEAGAVTTDDAEVARRVRVLRAHGETDKHVHEEIGWNERMDELQAAFLSVKLEHHEETQHARDDAVLHYAAGLVSVPGVDTLACSPDARHVRHLMVITVPNRDRVLGSLRSQGVEAAVHYPTPIHHQPAFRRFGDAVSCPNAERLSRSVISLPLYPGITPGQIERCVEALAIALGRAA